MSKHLNKIFQFFLFLGLGAGLMYWIYIKQAHSYDAYCLEQNIPQSDCNLIDKLWNDLLHVKLIYVFIIFIAFFLSNYFRSLRWRMILQSIGYNIRPINSIGSILIGYLANLGLPRSGEFIRAALLSKYEKVPLTISVGTVVLDRLLDMLAMFFIILFTVITQRKTFAQFYYDHLAHIPLIQQLFFPVLGLMILIIGFFTRNIWRDWPTVIKIKNKIRGFLDGLLAIRNIEHKASFFLYTSMIWVWFFVMMYCALKSFGPTESLPLSSALVIYVFGSLGMLVPTPGGMGSYHFLIILSLSYYGIHQVNAFSFANISFFSANFANNLTLGLSAIIVMYFYNKKYPKQVEESLMNNIDKPI